MSNLVKATPYYIKKIIEEEKEILSEHQRYRMMIIREGARLKQEGYTRDEINESLMSIISGLGGGFIQTIKNVCEYSRVSCSRAP